MTEEPFDAETTDGARGDTDEHGEPEAATPQTVASDGVTSEVSPVDEMTAPRVAEAPVRPTAQSELDLGVVSTGSAEIDGALRPLESLDERAVAEHAEAYEQVLADLTAAMSESPVTASHEHDGSTG